MKMLARKVSNVYAVCAFAAIGGGLFGFDISSMAGVIGTQAYQNYFGNPVSYTQGYITAMMPAGSMFGAVAASLIGDRFSRKVAIQISTIFWILGSAIMAASNGVPVLMIGRVVAGLGVGMASTIVPIYQAEIAPKEIRGRVITLQQWAITWGILITYFIQYGSSFIDGGPENDQQSTLAFRIPWAVQTVPAFILLLGLPFLPYSPRWLASKDRWEEAIQVLADLHAHGDLRNPKVLAQYREIEESLRFEMETRAAGWAALIEPQLSRRVILGMAVQVWSALSGMNVMMYYVVYVMQSAGIGSPLLAAAIQYIINVIMTLPAIIWVDTWGRRPLMLLGSIGMSVLSFATGGIQASYGQPNTEPGAETTWMIVGHMDASRGVVACSYLLVAVFATTWGPASWTYPAEIFPNKVRAKAVSISTATNWTVNTILAFAVPALLNSINWKTFMLFATFNALAFFHMFFCAPETKNFTLEEMDALFARNGHRVWKRNPFARSGAEAQSGLDELERQIADGDVKVHAPQGTAREDQESKPIMVETVIEMTNRRMSSTSGHTDEIEMGKTRSPSTVPPEWYHAR